MQSCFVHGNASRGMSDVTDGAPESAIDFFPYFLTLLR